MIGYFAYLLENTGLILAFLLGGATHGLAMALGRDWKEKLQMSCIAGMFFGFVLAPAIIKLDHSNYKRHYATCQKYEAKRAGYIFSGERCYKPIAKDVYVKVNETTKTKQELFNAK